MPTRQPKRAEVEVFEQAVNAWIVRTPGRKYPAVVVQGDSLNQLFGLAQAVLEGVRADPSRREELLEDATALRDQLWSLLRAYEETLSEYGLPLPYNRVRWPE
jgi:hypothetical protein